MLPSQAVVSFANALAVELGLKPVDAFVSPFPGVGFQGDVDECRLRAAIAKTGFDSEPRRGGVVVTGNQVQCIVAYDAKRLEVQQV